MLLNELRRAAMRALPALVLAVLAWPAMASEIPLSFAPQTGFVKLRFPGDTRDTIAIAGRDDAGAPRLALITNIDGAAHAVERPLPDDAVAIDAGAAGPDHQALYVLCAGRVLRIDALDALPAPVAEAPSLYRGRSFAPLTASVDVASDIDGDDVAELLVQDFDVLTVLDGPAFERRRVLALPTLRRSFERAQNFRPVRIAAAPGPVPALVAVRGDDLLRFDLPRDAGNDANTPIEPAIAPLALGLSSERDIERFYNGDSELDQRDLTLHEPEILADVDGDGLPDLVTLETRSSGVFDKETTYRLHVAGDGLAYAAEPDAAFSSDGYQFGIRTVRLDRDNIALVAPAVRIGLRTIIGALFSRSVTLDIAIYAAGDAGVFGGEPSAEIRAKVRFDFGSGQVEFPTVAFGDLDGDGKRDLIVKRGRDELGWRRNLGGGAFDDDDSELELLAPKNGANIVAADLDGDGTDEVLARYDAQDGDELRRRLRVTAP